MKPGPLPKPGVLKLIEGNPGRRPINLSDGVNPTVEIPSPPKFLEGEALKEWKRITPILHELGLISQMDRAALAMYCSAYGQWANYETAYIKKVKAIAKKDGVDMDVAMERVSTMTTSSGYKQQSVLVQLIGRSRDEVNRLLGHFGLSPATRARVQPSSQLQQSLPGMEQKGFGQFAG